MWVHIVKMCIRDRYRHWCPGNFRNIHDKDLQFFLQNCDPKVFCVPSYPSFMLLAMVLRDSMVKKLYFIHYCS